MDEREVAISALEPTWTHLIPYNLRVYVVAIAAQFRIRHEVPAALAISVASAALGRGIQVRTTFGRTTTPNLFFLGAAPTGGWKGSISEPMFGAIYNATAGASGRSCAVVEDATPESLAAKAHEVGGVIASISSDANGALTTHMGKYAKSGQPDVAVLLKGFSNEELRQNRIGRSAVAVRVCLTISWLLQTPIVQALYANRALVEQGLMGRFLVFPFPDPITEVPAEEITPPVEEQRAFEARIAELVNSFYNLPQSHVISACKEARDILTQYETETLTAITSGSLRDFAPLAKRRGEIAWRTALVLHTFEHGAAAAQRDIDGETAGAAVLFVEWCSEFQNRLAEDAWASVDDQRLDKAMKLLKYNRGGVSARDLVRSSSIFENSKIALSILQQLENEGGVYSIRYGKSLRFFLGARGP